MTHTQQSRKAVFVQVRVINIRSKMTCIHNSTTHLLLYLSMRKIIVDRLMESLIQAQYQCNEFIDKQMDGQAIMNCKILIDDIHFGKVDEKKEKQSRAANK
jgi:hypothetical protein